MGIVREGHVVRGVPVQGVAVHREGDGVQHRVDRTHHLVMEVTVTVVTVTGVTLTEVTVTVVTMIVVTVTVVTVTGVTVTVAAKYYPLFQS